MRNAGLRFICRTEALRVETTGSAFTQGYVEGQVLRLPIAHHDGNYTADRETIARLEDEGRVAFRYVENPNGSQGAVAGVLSENRRILGMMPHPERAVDAGHGGTDGLALFRGVTEALVRA
jgi:phosphoribosylformylglycinamidine synthase